MVDTVDTLSPPASYSTNSLSQSRGEKIYCVNSCTLINCQRYSGMTNANRCRLFDSSYSLLATGSVSGVNATFSYPLVSGQYYFIEWDNSGASYSQAYDVTSVTYPVNGTNINYIDGTYAGATQGGVIYCAIISITTQIVSSSDNSALLISQDF